MANSRELKQPRLSNRRNTPFVLRGQKYHLRFIVVHIFVYESELKMRHFKRLIRETYLIV